LPCFPRRGGAPPTLAASPPALTQKRGPPSQAKHIHRPSARGSGGAQQHQQQRGSREATSEDAAARPSVRPPLGRRGRAGCV
jgi:hypothetical protein